MSVQFGGELFDTMADACDRCVSDWLYACGANNTSYVVAVLEEMTDSEIVEEMLINWPGPIGSTSEDLVDATAMFRERIQETVEAAGDSHLYR